MLPPAPRPTPAPEIGRVLVQFRATLRRYMESAPLAPEDKAEIRILTGQLTRAEEDPAHPLRRLMLLAETAGYERGNNG